jgi:endoglucanase
MRKLLSLALVVAIMLILGPEPAAQEKATDIHAANKKLGRGMNLGNALEAPNEGEWGVTLKAEYFKTIKDAGFASVRLPVRWSAHAKAEAPYTIDAKFAERVDWAIDQALASKLAIIVNVHHYDEMFVDPDKHLPRLIGLWEQIATRYKDRPDSVFFELLNEPNGKLTEAKWNAAFPQVLAVVRKTNPTRPVLIGPGQWNAIRVLDKLELPKDDRNLILTVHCYDPFEFTHQGAPWVKGAEKWKGRMWTGTESEKNALRATLDKAAAWAKANDRPVFLGEFGAYEVADMDSRARWTRFMAREAEQRKFTWAYWEFCSGFGAYDPKTDEWRPALKAALIE